nr:hypothetical protein [Sporomusa sp. KB1]
MIAFASLIVLIINRK